MTSLADVAGTARANDTTNSPERPPECVNSRFLNTGERFFLDSFCLSSLEKECRTTIEGLEMSRVDLGHLEDSNSDADDKKCQDNGNNLTCGGLETLEQDLEDNIRGTDVDNRTRHTTVVTIEQNETVAREQEGQDRIGQDRNVHIT
jgi:hypothetical protein